MASHTATQRKLPIALQGEKVARDNARLLNCWIGISPSENIGTGFCVGCEFVEMCKSMYLMFGGSRKMHPSRQARKTLEEFSIESEYL